jgi:hypothetical protein
VQQVSDYDPDVVWPHKEALCQLLRTLVKKIFGVLPHSSSVGGR